MMTLQLDLPGEPVVSPSTRVQWVEALAQLRQELEQASRDNDLSSLLDAQVSAGLVLFDITQKLQLDAQEQFVVLGQELLDQILIVLDAQGVQAQ